MKTEKTDGHVSSGDVDETPHAAKAGEMLNASIGDSIDLLVEYLVDNDVRGIHPLIMGEVEKRLIVRVLQRSRGNKVQAAKMLGMSRNTFQRKIQKLGEDLRFPDVNPGS
jgi:Fis family transcriptional regulator, factor for inversion stimulation protein